MNNGCKDASALRPIENARARVSPRNLASTEKDTNALNVFSQEPYKYIEMALCV